MTTGRKSRIQDVSQPQQAYVEVIGALIREKGTASTTLLAERLGVTLPSASEEISRLAELGLVRRISRFEIGLTPRGRLIAAQLDRRHASLRQFMVNVLCMDAAEADKIACRLEHYVDGDFAGRLTELARILKTSHALKAVAERMRGAKAGKRATGRNSADS